MRRRGLIQAQEFWEGVRLTDYDFKGYLSSKETFLKSYDPMHCACVLINACQTISLSTNYLRSHLIHIPDVAQSTF